MLIIILFNIIFILKFFRYISYIIVDNKEKHNVAGAIRACFSVILLLNIINMIGIKTPMLIFLFIFGILDILYNHHLIVMMFRVDVPVMNGTQEIITELFGRIGILLDIILMGSSLYILLGVFGIILTILSIVLIIFLIKFLYYPK